MKYCIREKKAGQIIDANEAGYTPPPDFTKQQEIAMELEAVGEGEAVKTPPANAVASKKSIGDAVTVGKEAKFPEQDEKKRNDVTYLARMRRFKLVGEDASLLELAQALNGVPSVGVTGSDKKLKAIISQGHFMKAVKNSGILTKEPVTVGDMFSLGKTPKKVDNALDTATLLDVLAEMGRLNRSAFAIVDKAGTFLGALNIKDTSALAKMSKDSAKVSTSKYLETQEDTALTCQADETLCTAMGKICTKKSHRIFLVDDKKALVSVLSLTDVIRLVKK